MSKLLYASIRNPKCDSLSQKNIESLSSRIEPDNISFLPPKIIRDTRNIAVIFNPNSSIEIHDSSICLGKMINPASSWWEPMSDIPDGSYALFRSNEKYVEVVSDVVASRTIWYFHDENIFIASTSQRAIVFFLKTFDFNQAVISWMLSTGTLGPGYSWDSRVKFLEGNSSIILDCYSWELKLNNSNINLNLVERAEEEHERQLRQALNKTFESINLDYSKWVLPLSGGYDSRCILGMLRKKDNLKCVTWGLEKAQFEKDNDAFIARELSSFFGLDHKYFLTDISDEQLETIFNRFLICGEGRIDHISGYMDGFRIWKTLFEEGIEGIIRGDQPFGGVSSVSSPLNVRLLAAVPLISDFANLKNIDKLGINPQSLPIWLDKKETESLESWRDRLYLQFRIPFVLAALSDLKLSYVEIINPLLTRKIVSVAGELPAYLRTNKRLFKKIVNLISPNIDYAKYPAIDQPKDILKRKDVIKIITKELRSEEATSVLPQKFIDFVLDKISVAENETSARNVNLQSYLKVKIESIYNRLLISSFSRKNEGTDIRPRIDYNILAFRAYIICVMHRTLVSDAKSLIQ